MHDGIGLPPCRRRARSTGMQPRSPSKCSLGYGARPGTRDADGSRDRAGRARRTARRTACTRRRRFSTPTRLTGDDAWLGPRDRRDCTTVAAPTGTPKGGFFDVARDRSGTAYPRRLRSRARLADALCKRCRRAVLARLGALTDDKEWRRPARSQLATFGGAAAQLSCTARRLVRASTGRSTRSRE